MVDSLDTRLATERITCRLVEDHALLHCKGCGLGTRTRTQPRRQFLDDVRAFIRSHRDCPLT